MLLQAVTALAFAEGGRLLVSAGGDTLVAVWQLLDVLDAPASPTPPAPLYSWCGPLAAVVLLASLLGFWGLGCRVLMTGLSGAAPAAVLLVRLHGMVVVPLVPHLGFQDLWCRVLGLPRRRCLRRCSPGTASWRGGTACAAFRLSGFVVLGV